jgi:ribosome-associated protein
LRPGRLEKSNTIGHILERWEKFVASRINDVFSGHAGASRNQITTEGIDLIMHSSTGAALNGKPKSAPVTKLNATAGILTTVLDSLSDAKAEDIVSIDIEGKTSIGDHMVIASGRSQRHVGAIADQLRDKLKGHGVQQLRVEGLPHCDWVLIDAGDVIVHIFRPEVRQFYNLEKMWSAERPNDPVAV